jgi:hypothetical protein
MFFQKYLFLKYPESCFFTISFDMLKIKNYPDHDFFIVTWKKFNVYVNKIKKGPFSQIQFY